MALYKNTGIIKSLHILCWIFCEIFISKCRWADFLWILFFTQDRIKRRVYATVIELHLITRFDIAKKISFPCERSCDVSTLNPKLRPSLNPSDIPHVQSELILSKIHIQGIRRHLDNHLFPMQISPKMFKKMFKKSIYVECTKNCLLCRL